MLCDAAFTNDCDARSGVAKTWAVCKSESAEILASGIKQTVPRILEVSPKYGNSVFANKGPHHSRSKPAQCRHLRPLR